MKKLIFLSLVSFVFPLLAAPTANDDAIKKHVEDLFAASKKINAAESKQARSQIENALDWDKIAELCLGAGRWKSTSASNRAEFKRLLKEVILKTAFSRLDKFWTPDLTYEFQPIVWKGGNAEVPVKFTVKGEPFVLEYFLTKKSGKWTIFDVSYEDVRYSVNINEQIDAFLKEKGFHELLGKLKHRLEDLDNPTKKKSS
jgi:ABC-type transporter MlaC component